MLAAWQAAAPLSCLLHWLMSFHDHKGIVWNDLRSSGTCWMTCTKLSSPPWHLISQLIPDGALQFSVSSFACPEPMCPISPLLKTLGVCFNLMEVVGYKEHLKIKVVSQPCERVAYFNAHAAFVSSHLNANWYADVIRHKGMEIFF